MTGAGDTDHQPADTQSASQSAPSDPRADVLTPSSA
eukprot:gene15880-51572_t